MRTEEQKEVREPLLSDAELRNWRDEEAVDHGIAKDTGAYTSLLDIAKEVVYFYEDLITKGELRVMKKATNIGGLPRFAFLCSVCGLAHSADFKWDFCPGCGAEIVK